MNKKKQTIRLVDAPLYSYWQALYLAFYSSRLYIDVAKRWRGYGVLYLLLVVAIATIPVSVRMIFTFNQFFNEQMILPLEALPLLYVQNGQVKFDKPMPYLIKNRTGDVVAIIDTTGVVSKMNKLYPKLTILITKDTFYFRPPPFPLFITESQKGVEGSIYAQSLGKETNEVFVGKDWIATSGILKLKWMAEILVYPLVTGFFFGLYVVTMLFLAFIGQLLSLIIFKFKLSFKEACRLFLVAATAQTIIFSLFIALNIIIPYAGIFYTALLSAYFSYAVLAVRRESKTMVRM